MDHIMVHIGITGVMTLGTTEVITIHGITEDTGADITAITGDGMIHGTTTIIIADGIILHTITMAARHTLLAELQKAIQTDTTAFAPIQNPLVLFLPAIILQASHLLPQDLAQVPAEEE